MDLAHAADRQGRAAGALAQVARGLVGLDVDDDVAAGQGVPDRGLDRVGDGVALADGRVGADADHDVDEVPARRLAQPQAAHVDRRLGLGDGRAGALVGAARRAVHEHVDVLAHEPQAAVTTSTATSRAATGRPRAPRRG